MMAKDPLVERYVNMIYDLRKLMIASRSMIRKRKSPLARKINNGNLRAIMDAAHSVFHGSLDPEKKNEICQKITDVINNFHKDAKATTREIIAVLVGYVVGTINVASGLIFSILWVIRERLYKYICPEHCHRLLP